MIEKINRKKKEIEALSPSKTLDLEFFEKVKIDFTYHSNNLENNSLTYGQTAKFLKEVGEKRSMYLMKNPIREYLDIESHFKILDQVFDLYGEDFSLKNILEMHHKLMLNPDQWDYYSWYSPGKFKTHDNYTSTVSGKIHKYIDPKDVEKELQKLIDKVNTDCKQHDIDLIDKHPITTATYLHNRFMEIHPFEDGNGRMGRILTNMVLLKSNLPPIFTSLPNRVKYMELFEVSNSTNLDKMRNFFSTQLLESLDKKKQMVESALNIFTKNNLQKGMGL
jgi:Fic family protein